jgi:hypothetical protein
VYSTSRLSAERVSGVADAAGRADARIERGGDPGLPDRLLSRHLERHLARGHAARGQAVEQPRPRRLGEGGRLPTHTCDGAPDDSSAIYPTTKTPYAGQPKRPAAARSTVSSAGAKNGGRIANCSSRPPPASGSLGAEGVEDPRHRNRALSHAGARLGPQRHGLVAHREHLWVSPPCIRRLLQYAAHDGATDDKTTRSIGRCRGIVVGADHVEKCSCC